MSGPSDQSSAVRQELMQAQTKVAEPTPTPPPPPPVVVQAPPSKNPDETHDKKKKLKKDEYSALPGVMNSAVFNKGVA